MPGLLVTLKNMNNINSKNRYNAVKVTEECEKSGLDLISRFPYSLDKLSVPYDINNVDNYCDTIIELCVTVNTFTSLKTHKWSHLRRLTLYGHFDPFNYDKEHDAVTRNLRNCTSLTHLSIDSLVEGCLLFAWKNLLQLIHLRCSGFRTIKVRGTKSRFKRIINLPSNMNIRSLIVSKMPQCSNLIMLLPILGFLKTNRIDNVDDFMIHHGGSRITRIEVDKKVNGAYDNIYHVPLIDYVDSFHHYCILIDPPKLSVDDHLKNVTVKQTDVKMTCMFSSLMLKYLLATSLKIVPMPDHCVSFHQVMNQLLMNGAAAPAHVNFEEGTWLHSMNSTLLDRKSLFRHIENIPYYVFRYMFVDDALYFNYRFTAARKFEFNHNVVIIDMATRYDKVTNASPVAEIYRNGRFFWLNVDGLDIANPLPRDSWHFASRQYCFLGVYVRVDHTKPIGLIIDTKREYRRISTSTIVQLFSDIYYQTCNKEYANALVKCHAANVMNDVLFKQGPTYTKLYDMLSHAMYDEQAICVVIDEADPFMLTSIAAGYFDVDYMFVDYECTITNATVLASVESIAMPRCRQYWAVINGHPIGYAPEINRQHMQRSLSTLKFIKRNDAEVPIRLTTC